MQTITLLSQRELILTEIRKKVAQKHQTLEEAIAARNLYFRVSLVGTCNLACPFCHNEGASRKGRLDVPFVTDAIQSASEIGFKRVQFTGGEPLLHWQVAKFVGRARSIMPDVGITTNGTFLKKRIHDLMNAGLTRLHISLQVEPLRKAGKNGVWGVPDWLEPMLSYAAEGRFFLRLNMPVPMNELERARNFLETMAPYGCDLKVFSILPEGESANEAYSIEKLEELVEVENKRRLQALQSGRIYLRGYLSPTGIRCQTCPDFSRCKEQCHSLRLGADHILRPCLATREWDSVLTKEDMRAQIEEAAWLALDYWW